MSLISIPHSLYDTNVLFQTKDASKSVDKLVFFEEPVGTFFSDNMIKNSEKYIKSFYHTNMSCSKSLPCPQEFVLYAINVSVLYFSKPGFVGIFDEFKKNSFALDIVNLMEQSYFTIYMNNRVVLNFTWDMLMDCGGDYYYKGRYDCVSPCELLQLGTIYVVLNFNKFIVNFNKIMIRISLDGILKRELR